MGIVNTTPDSFSDGGEYLQTDAAVAHALRLADQGADILDIGGESTRPGAAEVSLQEELDRVIPVIERLRDATDTPISIDTYKPEVMSAALDAGAAMINDVNGLQAEGAIKVAAQAQVPVCIMHMQNNPRTMQQAPQYDNVVDEVINFLRQRIARCAEQGLGKDLIVTDPGIGFGKTLAHNLALLNQVPRLREALACEVLIGVSRKSMIDMLLDREVDHRLAASLGLAVQAALNGAKILRVHDVAATYDAIRAAEAVSSADAGKQA